MAHLRLNILLKYCMIHYLTQRNAHLTFLRRSQELKGFPHFLLIKFFPNILNYIALKKQVGKKQGTKSQAKSSSPVGSVALGNVLAVKNVYRQFDETYDFEFSFLDERLNQQYKSEQHAGTVFGLFAFLAIVIACFGLFGMAIITFNQRIKEVSIHKIMGASVPNLIRLLLGDFTKLISIAILIAAPVAWWIMTNWLNNFTYRVTINPVVFVVSGFTLLIIAWITLSYFTIKTARVNPAQTLRSE